MSTPATYSFLGEAPAPAATTLYIIMDGDPQGAATYFRAMLVADEGSSAVAFIRANDKSVLVTGHDVWANSCYRYTLTDMQLLAEKRLVDFEEGWETIFEGDLVDFINNQPGPTIHRQALHQGGRVGYYTYDQLDEKVRKAYEDVRRADNEPGQPNLAKARQVLDRYKAVLLAAYRMEEFGETVVA